MLAKRNTNVSKESNRHLNAKGTPLRRPLSSKLNGPFGHAYILASAC